MNGKITHSLNDMRIADARVQKGIKTYLDKVMCYPHFDKFQMVKVYTDGNSDFTAFESVAYKISFFSFAHKISETLESPYEPIETDITSFYDRVVAL